MTSQEEVRPIDQIVDKFQSIYGVRPQIVSRAPVMCPIIGDRQSVTGLDSLQLALTLDICVAIAYEESASIQLMTSDGQSAPMQCGGGGAVSELSSLVCSTVQWLASNGYLPSVSVRLLFTVPELYGLIDSRPALLVATALALLHIRSSSAVDCEEPSNAQLAELLAPLGNASGLGALSIQAELLAPPAEDSAALCIGLHSCKSIQLPYGIVFVLAPSLSEPVPAAHFEAANQACRAAARLISNESTDCLAVACQASTLSEVNKLVSHLPPEMRGHVSYALKENVRLCSLVEALEQASATFDEASDEARHQTLSAMVAFRSVMSISNLSAKLDDGIENGRLDTLCEVAESAGALGARSLCGRGVLVLATENDGANVLDFLTQRYYGRLELLQRGQTPPLYIIDSLGEPACAHNVV